MMVAALTSSGVAGASKSSTEIVAAASVVPLFMRACSSGAGLGARVRVVDRACGTNGLAVGRNIDPLTSITSGDDLYCEKRLSTLVNVRTVRPSERLEAFWSWVDRTIRTILSNAQSLRDS